MPKGLEVQMCRERLRKLFCNGVSLSACRELRRLHINVLDTDKLPQIVSSFTHTVSDVSDVY